MSLWIIVIIWRGICEFADVRVEAQLSDSESSSGNKSGKSPRHD
jgi:hypothetical protein